MQAAGVTTRKRISQPRTPSETTPSPHPFLNPTERADESPASERGVVQFLKSATSTCTLSVLPLRNKASVTGCDDPDARIWHPPLIDQLRDNPVHPVNGDGEANAGIGARGRENGRVDSDESTCGIKQGAAGIAGIDGGIGLNHAGYFPPGAGRQAALE